MNQYSKSLEIPRTKAEIDDFNHRIRNGWKVYGISGMAPIFWSSDFPDHLWALWELELDNWRQVAPTETILLPGSVVEVKQAIERVWRIVTPEYFSKSPLYMDPSSIIRLSSHMLTRVERLLPSIDAIITRMRSQVGQRYIWWGNTPDGIHEMLGKYGPIPDSQEEKEKMIFKGFDCSGLLYWATNGATPRNTSDLLSYGAWVDIENKSIEDIIKTLKPLDIIVWGISWHCLIVLKNGEVIDSSVNWWTEWLYSEPNGVRIRNIDDVLSDIMSGPDARMPTNNYATSDQSKAFVVHRWR